MFVRKIMRSFYSVLHLVVIATFHIHTSMIFVTADADEAANFTIRWKEPSSHIFKLSSASFQNISLDGIDYPSTPLEDDGDSNKGREINVDDSKYPTGNSSYLRQSMMIGHDFKTPSETDTTTNNTKAHRGRCSASIYSCQGRCKSTPRLACSCHVTCQTYGNCCEDFEDACPDLVLKSRPTSFPTVVGIQCFNNNFLISSCSRRSVGEGKNGPGDDNTSPNVTMRSFGKQSTQSLNIDMDIIVERCYENTDTNDTLFQTPVTDSISRLQFKNVFCALCNGVTDVEIWIGLVHCKHNNNSINFDRPNLIFERINGTNVTEITPRDLFQNGKCRTFWTPETDSPNPCLHENQLKPARLVVPEDSETLDGFRATIEKSRQINVDGNMNRTRKTNKTTLEKFNSLHLQWQNMSDSIFNKSFLEEKCATLNSFIQYPRNPSSRYKNKYCHLLDDDATAVKKFCEPNLKISGDEGVWYTMVFGGINTNNDRDESNYLLSDKLWRIHSGIEQQFWDRLVKKVNLTNCDPEAYVRIKGKCRKKTFTLNVKMTFKFIRSSVIRGNFNNQVEKYTRILRDTFVDDLSNRTACVVLSYEHNKVTGSSVLYQSTTKFQCVKMSDTDTRSSKSGSTTLINGDSIEDAEVNNYVLFVHDTINIVMKKEKAITLPLALEVSMCVFPNKMSKRVLGYCADIESTWRVVSKMDALIGGMSLEEILTIICCLLSVLGLFIRIALQNVVPFYKSHPGKVQFGLCLSLFLAYSLFMFGGLVEGGTNTCMVLAILTHLAFVSALFWMNVTAFEIWRTFRTLQNQVISQGHLGMILPVLYAVGIPLCLVVTALLMEEFFPHSEFSPSYGEHNCWLNGSMAVALYFVSPCCLICCVNAIFVGLTLMSLRRQHASISEFKKSNPITAVTDIVIVVKIILLVGITWLLGLVAALVDHEVLWILFTVINASLGFTISVVLVFNKRVYYAIHDKCLCNNSETITVVSTQIARH